MANQSVLVHIKLVVVLYTEKKSGMKEFINFIRDRVAAYKEKGPLTLKPAN